MAAPDTDTHEDLPAVYSEAHIRAEFRHWSRQLNETRAGTGKFTEGACLAWCEKWLDEFLDRRGR